MKTGYYVILTVFAFSINAASAQDIEKGKWYMKQEQYKTAQRMFNSLISNNPSDALAYFYLGQIYFTFNKPDSANFFYQKGLTANPLEPLNYAGTGKILLNKGNRPEALISFEKGKKLAKKNTAYYIEVANACFSGKVKDYETATLYLNEARKINPRNPYYYLKLGEMNLLIKTPGDAANDFENAIFYDKNCIEAYVKLGKLYYEGKDFRDALDAFTIAIGLDSSQILVYKYVGDLYYGFGRYPEAKKYYELYLAKSEYNPQDKEKYAFILFFNKNYKEAEEIMNEVVEAYPDLPVLYRLQSYIDYENGNYVEGLKNMQNFFAIQDTSKVIPLDYVYYGRLLLKNNQDSAGVIVLKKAIEADTTRYDLYDEIARSYSKLKKHVDAIAAYQQFLKRNPKSQANLLYQIGREYYLEAEESVNPQDSILKLTMYKNADSTFTLLTQIDSTSFIGYIWRGRCLSKQDPEAIAGLAKPLYDKALAVLETGDTIKNQKFIMECYRYQAFYYYVLGEKEFKTHPVDAKQNLSISLDYWKKILVMDPNDMQAKTAIENLKKVLK